MSPSSGAGARKTLTTSSFARPDETRSFDKGKIEIISCEGVTFGKATFEPGWKWSTCLQPIAQTKTCQASHLGYQVSGRMHIVMDDGTQKEVGPGEIFSIPPGHDAWVVGNEPVVILDITGAEKYAKR